MARLFWRRALLAGWVLSVFSLSGSAASAVDIDGVQAAALDQPQICMLLRRTPTGDPLLADFGIDGSTISIQAYYDTGASGILLSRDTAEYLGVQKSYVGGTAVTFSDVGVGGTTDFDVSESLYAALAPFGVAIDLENQANYTQSFGPLRTQISREYALSPTLAIDVVGAPAMAGKIVVMDPKPVENIFDFLADPNWENLDLDMQIHTHVYDPGTPFTPGNVLSPGIPTTSHHVSLSSGDFSRFTEVTPTGAEGPTLVENPFIGPNPVAQLDAGLPADDTPGVTISLGGISSTGSFLFDTGAAASMISSHVAADLNVRYVSGTEGTASPLLEIFDPEHPELAGATIAEQFQLTISGIGGDSNVAGFYLDSLLLPTMEGNPLDVNDPNHLRFLNAPVLVADIVLQDPDTLQSLTLDGILGMNFLVASTEIIGMTFGAMSSGSFDWIVYDQPNGVLGLDLKTVPEPATLVLLAVAALMFYVRRLARRA